MRTELCDMFGIDVPIFAFSHCRDVVAAVTNAGGAEPAQRRAVDIVDPGYTRYEKQCESKLTPTFMSKMPLVS